MKPLQEANLKDEIALISQFINEMLPQDTENLKGVLISPQTYSRHMAVLYLTIECMKSRVFDLGKATGDYRTHQMLKDYLEGLGL